MTSAGGAGSERGVGVERGVGTANAAGTANAVGAAHVTGTASAVGAAHVTGAERGVGVPLLSAALVLWAVAWLAVLLPTSWSPPSDTVEQLIWVRSLQWGYYKHPPLPTWLLRPVVDVLGPGQPAAALLTALLLCAGLALCWDLCRRLVGRHEATLLVAGMSLIGWFGPRMLFYNHDVVLMTLVALAAWACERALRTGRRADWTVVGLALGLGMLAKYQMCLAALSVVLCWLAARGWKRPEQRRGLAIAVALSALLFAPHVAWLASRHFETLGYAVDSGLGAAFGPMRRVTHGLQFLLHQLGRCALPIAVGAALLAAGLRRGTPPPRAPRRPERAAATRFLFLWGVVPALVIVVIGLVTGGRLQYHWATSFLMLGLAWLGSLVPARRWAVVAPRPALAAVAVATLASLGVAWASAPGGLGLKYASHLQAFFPAAQIAQRIGDDARRELGGPIRYLAGPWYLPGAIGLHLAEHPLVIIDGDAAKAPWIDMEHARDCGIVWIGDANPNPARVKFFQDVTWRVEPARDPDACAATARAHGLP